MTPVFYTMLTLRRTLWHQYSIPCRPYVPHYDTSILYNVDLTYRIMTPVFYTMLTLRRASW